MNSNFDFLKEDWPKQYKQLLVAEKTARSVPRVSVAACRMTLEYAVKWLYRFDKTIPASLGQPTLRDMMAAPVFKGLLAPGLADRIRLVRELGNMAVHQMDKTILEKDALNSLRHLFAFLLWLFRTYNDPPPPAQSFSAQRLTQKSKTAAVDTGTQMQQIENQRRALEEQLEEERTAHAADREELERLRAENAAIKAANAPLTKDYDYTEEETREQFIDLLLREAGWDPHAPNTREYAVTGMPDGNGGTKTGRVDYVLWGDDGKPLAIIEAKRYKRDHRSGAKQAELYADCLEKMTGQRPVIFLSNGYRHQIWDDARGYPQRDVQGFYGKAGLELTIQRRRTVKDLRAQPIDSAIVDRDYQHEAIRRVNEAFMMQRRKALLVLATGAGKTRLSIALVKQLMRAGWIKRALFLADRTELVKQAKTSFKVHYKEASQVNLLADKDDVTSRVAFCTYQTMMNVIDQDDKENRKRFGVDHFDLVIIDEAHRSVYKKYGVIFDYFDALLLGLTATPVDYVSRNTYTLFQCTNYEPTFYYSLAEAVERKYLVPPRRMLVPVEFHREGIRYDQLSREEKEDYEEQFFDRETDTLPERIAASKLNKKLFNRDSTYKILKHLLDHGHRIEGGDKLGKTIIFAANKEHAYYIKEVFEECWPHLEKYMVVIECTADYVGRSVDDFKKPDGRRRIAVSVDMLDTGIDIHEIVNLVFYKVVRSRAKFEQMIGRGTRTCPNVFGPGKDKENFFVFDFYDNFTYFDMHPQGVAPAVVEAVSQKIFKKRFLLSELLGPAGGHEDLQKKLLDQLHGETKRLDLNSVHVRRGGKREIVERFHERARWDMVALEDHDDIENQLAPLVIPEDKDESARRFDLMVLNTQLAVFENLDTKDALLDRLVQTVEPLTQMSNIPDVAAQMALLERIVAPDFAGTVTIELLETIREKVRELICFLRDTSRHDLIFIDYQDTLGQPVGDDVGVKEDPNFDGYRRKVERYIRENRDHMTILKLHTNQPITELELRELERMLFEHSGAQSLEDFRRRMGTDEPLGQFIRSVTGLEMEALQEAFSSLLKDTAFSADQIKFIDTILQYYHRNGYFEVGQLFNSPFTDFHHGGPTKLFPPEEAASLFKIIEDINDNAVCA